jgi:hypothetical protein
VAAKKGRPKKHERRKSIMDHIEESAKKKSKGTNQMYCSICEKINHSTNDRYKSKWRDAQIGEKSEENAEAPV